MRHAPLGRDPPMRPLLAACLSAEVVACAPATVPRAAPPIAPTASPVRVFRAPVATSQSAPTTVPSGPPNPPATATLATIVAQPEPTPLAPRSVPMLDCLLDGILPDSGATYALVLEDLASGARAQINADQMLPSASLYKLGLAWTVLR